MSKSAAIRVLVVDDDRELADLMVEALAAEGYRAISAYGGIMACEVATAFMPQVVLLDASMPVLDGFATLARLRAIPGLAGSVYVAVTGHGRPEDARRSLDAGFKIHLAKPVSVEQLVDVVARCTDSGWLAVPRVHDSDGPAEVHG